MKKFLLILLSASVGLNFYLVNVEVVVKDELDQEHHPLPERDRISLAQAAIQKGDSLEKEECEPKIVEKIVYKEVPHRDSAGNEFGESQPEEIGEKLTPEEIQKLTEKYNKKWLLESQEFFAYDLGISASQQAEYENLKRQREMEIAQFIKTARGKMSEESKHKGFILSPEEMVKMGKINEKYMTKLKRAFGQTAYLEYLSFRETYNRKIMEESNHEMIFGVQF